MLFGTLTALIALIALAALAPAAAQRLTKPWLSPAFDPMVFRANILQVLPPTPSRHDKWGAGWLPVACLGLGRQFGVDPREIEAYNVYYADCGSSWVLCRQTSSPVPIAALIEWFGRYPVGMRDEVRHILAIAAGGGGLSWGDNMLLRGHYDFGTLGHEMAHNIDRGYGPDPANVVPGAAWFTSTPAWRTAYANDSHVPDQYAQTSHAEDWASVVGLALYDNVVPGGLRGLIPNQWQHIFHQYATAQAKLGSAIKKGGYCKRRWANDAPAPTKRSRVARAPQEEREEDN